MTMAAVPNREYGAAIRKRMLELKALVTGSFGPKELAHIAHDCAAATRVSATVERTPPTDHRHGFQRLRVVIGRTPARTARATERSRNTSRSSRSPATWPARVGVARRGHRRPGRRATARRPARAAHGSR